MPSKKKKYNARFPAGRIKKIMQSDEEVGKVAQAVPIIISRTLELFVESMLTKTLQITNARNAKTLSPSHMKQCIMSESRFDFLRELVKNIPDINLADEILAESGELTPTTSQLPAVANVTFDWNGDCKIETAAKNSPMPTTSSYQHNYVHSNRTATTATVKPHSFQKQISLDPNYTSSTYMSAAPNFYKELPDCSTSAGYSFQFNPNNSNTQPKQTVIKNNGNNKRPETAVTLMRDIRSPKMVRLDSAPANLSSNDNHTVVSRTSDPTPLNSLLSSIPEAALSNTNSINQFKYQMPFSRINSSPSTSVTGSITTHSNHNQYTLPSSSTSYPSTSKDVSTRSAPIYNIDVASNSPVIKIDYSNLNFNIQSTSKGSEMIGMTNKQYNLPSTSMENVTPSINIDLSNNFITAQPASIYRSNSINSSNSNNSCVTTNSIFLKSTTSSLDMDEDYDNI